MRRHLWWTHWGTKSRNFYPKKKVCDAMRCDGMRCDAVDGHGYSYVTRAKKTNIQTTHPSSRRHIMVFWRASIPFFNHDKGKSWNWVVSSPSFLRQRVTHDRPVSENTIIPSSKDFNRSSTGLRSSEPYCIFLSKYRYGNGRKCQELACASDRVPWYLTT